MNDQPNMQKGKPLNLKRHVEYAAGSVVSEALIKKIGNITLFAFDEGQGLHEHTADCDVKWRSTCEN
jgi:hypothetical protein